MYFVTFLLNQKPVVGILAKNKQFVIPLKEAEKIYCGMQTLPDTMLELIEQGAESLEQVEEIIAAFDERCPLFALNEIRLLAPIERPKRNIFCVGKNYVEHALEMADVKNVDTAVPKIPVIFSKPPTCVIGPNDIVKHHRPIIEKLDYEVELAVIIGKKGFRILKEEAYEYVFGYSIMNDVSARDLQKEHIQWLMGKGADTFAPLGPCIAHKCEIPNPHNLSIKSIINGQLRQNANTKDMIFSIPTLIATISSVITLEPGDIIATGTPKGVGNGFNPPRLLNPGDEMHLEIEKIGVLINTIEKYTRER